MSLVRNAGYNLIGSFIPIVLALVTVPVYLKLVGNERYGVLAIAWILLGYFGWFDLGLSRATAYRIAALRDAPDIERAKTFWTAIGVNIGIGLVGGLILWPVSYWYFATQFQVSEALRGEILTAAPLLGLSLPVATMSGVLMGALQGRERFLEINSITTTNTILFQLFPLAVAWLHGPNLFWLLCAALGARVICLISFWVRCNIHVIRGHHFMFDRAQMVALLKYGGWVTVASILAPLLVMADRFLIGAAIGAVAVTIYTVPFQLAQRLTILPQAIGGALFPRLSSSTGDVQAALSLQASRALACLMTLPVLWGVSLMGLFLHFWVGPKLGGPGAPIGQIFLLGYWANAFATIPYVRLQARGRPDVVTKRLILQIPFYLVLLYFALHRFGLIGAVTIFSIRCAVDFLLLAEGAGKPYPPFMLILVNFALLAAASIITALFPTNLAVIAATLVIGSALASWISWRNLPDDIAARLRQMLAGLMRRPRSA